MSLSDSTLELLKIEKVTESLTEIQASWFSVLNSLFIITLAPLFSKWWESKYNPSANMKYGIGMFLLAIGMACVAFGAGGIEPGAQTASVSIIWLILVYFFLCISPVGLSYVIGACKNDSFYVWSLVFGRSNRYERCRKIW